MKITLNKNEVEIITQSIKACREIDALDSWSLSDLDDVRIFALQIAKILEGKLLPKE